MCVGKAVTKWNDEKKGKGMVKMKINRSKGMEPNTKLGEIATFLPMLII